MNKNSTKNSRHWLNDRSSINLPSVQQLTFTRRCLWLLGLTVLISDKYLVIDVICTEFRRFNRWCHNDADGGCWPWRQRRRWLRDTVMVHWNGVKRRRCVFLSNERIGVIIRLRWDSAEENIQKTSNLFIEDDLSSFTVDGTGNNFRGSHEDHVVHKKSKLD